ncbi:hypothetical protein BHE74_00020156 [Ensete ventricosum]|nr:hypothetical protein GW17_00013274 [Ensete ventricosum]RWW72059.1 hypothetical protein BHE74_00020156 [Ensete ventricosum]RZR99926.1 hypothetical protein BHM03_00029558 [Ensete ventricosum]
MVQLMVLNLNSRPVLVRYGSGMYQHINTLYVSIPAGTEKDGRGGGRRRRVRGRGEVSERMRQWAAVGRENRGRETEGWNQEKEREREKGVRLKR